MGIGIREQIEDLKERIERIENGKFTIRPRRPKIWPKPTPAPEVRPLPIESPWHRQTEDR